MRVLIKFVFVIPLSLSCFAETLELSQVTSAIRDILDKTQNKFQIYEEQIHSNTHKLKNKIENTPSYMKNYIVWEIIRSILNEEEEKVLENIKRTIDFTSDNLVEYFNRNEPESYVEKKLSAQANVWSQMQKNDKLRSLPFEEIFRFIIDGDREKLGSYAFEDEPGYIISSLKALKKVFEDSESHMIPHVTLDWYINLHKQITEGVLRKHIYSEFEQGIYNGNQYYSVLALDEEDSLDHDQIGIDDLKKRGVNYLNPHKAGAPFLLIEMGSSLEVQNNSPSLEGLRHLFNSFNSYIQTEDSPIMRLMAYAWLAREMEIRHVFKDGNGRTAALALYRLVAHDPELPMIMFHNPNILDGNGPEKLLYRLLEDMEKFNNNGKWLSDENHQQDGDEKYLNNLKINEKFDELIKAGKERVQGKDWSYFHNLISPPRI